MNTIQITDLESNSEHLLAFSSPSEPYTPDKNIYTNIYTYKNNVPQHNDISILLLYVTLYKIICFYLTARKPAQIIYILYRNYII